MATQEQAIKKWLMNVCSTRKAERLYSSGSEMRATRTMSTEILTTKTHPNLMMSGTEWPIRWASTTKAIGWDMQGTIAELLKYGMKVGEATIYQITRGPSTLRFGSHVKRGQPTILCPHSRWLCLIDRGTRQL